MIIYLYARAIAQDHLWDYTQGSTMRECTNFTVSGYYIYSKFSQSMTKRESINQKIKRNSRFKKVDCNSAPFQWRHDFTLRCCIMGNCVHVIFAWVGKKSITYVTKKTLNVISSWNFGTQTIFIYLYFISKRYSCQDINKTPVSVIKLQTS